MAEILIVDDEATFLATLILQLKRCGHHVLAAECAADALSQLERSEPHLAMIDIRLPDMDGLDLIARIRQAGRDFPIIVLTAYGSVQSAVAAIKAGATDYLQKPVAVDELEVVIDRVLRNCRLQDRLDVFERERKRLGAERSIIGNSAPMREAIALTEKIATVPPDPNGHLPTVLITGETGTGKDLFAHHLHDLGPHRDAPFVQINCTALPPSLVEGELFGYEKGAFTDAKNSKKGLFEVAAEGTVFLDEIGDMPLDLQAKLLLVLEKRRFRRLGGTIEREVKARTIAATNCELTKLVAEGRFRKDLLFRFKSLSIELPSLRARGDDIFLLADHFIRRQSARLHRPPPPLADAARQAMKHYSWPGNVRELDNVLQRAVLLQEGGVIEPADLNLCHFELAQTVSSLSTMVFPFGQENCSLAALEERLISQAIEYCNGNISEAARLLGLSRGALRHRMEKLNLALQPRHF
jgi:two-component system response regulator AtoC